MNCDELTATSGERMAANIANSAFKLKQKSFVSCLPMIVQRVYELIFLTVPKLFLGYFTRLPPKPMYHGSMNLILRRLIELNFERWVTWNFGPRLWTNEIDAFLLPILQPPL